MTATVVLNASYEVLAVVSWQRAVTLVVTGMAEIHEADPKRQVRGRTMQVPFPKVIRLIRYVYVTYRAIADDLHGPATKRGVLKRDKNTCIFCGDAAYTVDHLTPRSRGGKNTWENLAASCAACNQAKADRTPQEAGMRLLWAPYRPNSTKALQDKVWSGLVQPA